MGEHCFDVFYPCLSLVSNFAFIVFIAGFYDAGQRSKRSEEGRAIDGGWAQVGRRDGDKGGYERVFNRGTQWP